MLWLRMVTMALRSTSELSLTREVTFSIELIETFRSFSDKGLSQAPRKELRLNIPEIKINLSDNHFAPGSARMSIHARALPLHMEQSGRRPVCSILITKIHPMLVISINVHCQSNAFIFTHVLRRGGDMSHKISVFSNSSDPPIALPFSHSPFNSLILMKDLIRRV
jgi:hypothetical protein